METSLLPAVELLKKLACKQSVECARERATIGFIYDIPPAQLSDEQRQGIWMRQFAVFIPVLKQPISILNIK